MPLKPERILFHCGAELKKQIEEHAKARDVSVAYVIREALHKLLEGEKK